LGGGKTEADLEGQQLVVAATETKLVGARAERDLAKPPV